MIKKDVLHVLVFVVGGGGESFVFQLVRHYCIKCKNHITFTELRRVCVCVCFVWARE